MNDTRIMYRLAQTCEQLTKSQPIIHPFIENVIIRDNLRVLIIDNYFDITIAFQAPMELYNNCSSGGMGCIGGINSVPYDRNQRDRGNVHINCMDAVTDLAHGIMNCIGAKEKKQINLTGYGAGGALAVIFSEFLYDAGYTVNNLITFGQPRCADEDFINNVCNHVRYVRVVLQHDSMVNTPGNFGCFGGFVHGGRQHVLDLNGNLMPPKSDRDMAINYMMNKISTKPMRYTLTNYSRLSCTPQ